MRRQAADVIRSILSGECNDEAGARMLLSLTSEMPSDAEIVDMLEVVESHMVRVSGCENAMDMCGTGGDGKNTFNVSTAASFVVAASGVPVAKHGNRSSSGGVGSADIFEMLGLDIESCDPASLLTKHKICFLFARRYHPAIRRAAGARRIAAIPTIFNLLGPLCNPASVRQQLVGVSDSRALHAIPRILKRRGLESVMCVMSKDGTDEISAIAPTRIVQYVGGQTDSIVLDPMVVGISGGSMSEMVVHGRQEALQTFLDAVQGTANDTILNTTALNAAAALVVYGQCDTIRVGYDIAMEILRSGAAWQCLSGFVADAGDVAVLEGR